MKFSSAIGVAIVLAGGIFSFASCTKTQNDSIPRPSAYPRFELVHDSIGNRSSIENTFFSTSRSATFIPDSVNTLWANVEYPATYGATIHLSVSYPEDLESAVANRFQRFSLNLADSPATSEEFSTGNWNCFLLISERPTVTTPVQFFASNPDGRFVSGALVLQNPGTNADSISPLVATLTEDVRTLLFSLE